MTHALAMSMSRLPVDCHPVAARAAEVYAVVFPAGLQFTQADADSHYIEARTRLALINGTDGEASGDAETDRKKVRDDVPLFAGPESLSEVERTFAALGEAIGATRAREHSAGQG